MRVVKQANNGIDIRFKIIKWNIKNKKMELKIEFEMTNKI